VIHVGDVMYDAALCLGDIAETRSDIISRLGLTPGSFFLATIHRAENTDSPERLLGIFDAFREIATPECPVVLPLHPRTRSFLSQTRLKRLVEDGEGARGSSIRLIEPVSYLDFVSLEKSARVILTDSGGVQKEAYFHGVPCVTMRDETEWVETIDAGWNQLAGADSARIVEACATASPGRAIAEYGTGNAGEQVVRAICAFKKGSGPFCATVGWARAAIL